MAGYPHLTWDGATWRPFHDTDVALPQVVIAGEFTELAELDPALPVIARADRVDRVTEAHRQYRLRH
ncbi:MAG: hypothetical protein SFX73_36245 [Kofleriaceae bacterium]|nr:hypothetical protein [Kofleriaceae bacterium]